MSVTVRTPRGQLHVVDRPGDEPALVLMHGFPDDSRIYDRLVPGLDPRRVAAFDFLGYGRSDRSEAIPGEVPDRQQELTAPSRSAPPPSSPDACPVRSPSAFLASTRGGLTSGITMPTIIGATLVLIGAAVVALVLPAHQNGPSS